MNHYIKIMSIIIGALMQICTISAQTPVANRVKAAAENLPEGCKVVAKYTEINIIACFIPCITVFTNMTL